MFFRNKKTLLTLPLSLTLIGIGIFFFTKPTHGVNRTWDGGGGNSGWDTDANWSGDTEPGSGDIAIFDSSCVSNCSPTIDKNVNVGGIDMDSTYAGTITQTSTYTVTVGSSGWVHDGGTFTANGNAITINGTYTQTGGTFNASSSTISVSGNWTETSGAWNAQTSTLKFTYSNTITPGSVSYYNVEFYTSGGCTHTFAANMTVTHNLTKSGVGSENLSGGYTIYVAGNLDITGTGRFEYGYTTTITINGTGPQTLSSTGGGYWGCDIIINKPSGALTLSGTVSVRGDWIWTQGTLDAGTSTLRFPNNGDNNTITPGSVSYYNVEFASSNITHTFNSNMTVTHNLTKSADGPSTLSGGYTIYVAGNLDISGTGNIDSSSTTTITINGTGPQTLSSTGGGYWGCDIIINKPSGALTLSGTVSVRGDWIWTQGTLDAGTSTLRFPNNGDNNTITPGSVSYYNVEFYTIGGCTHTFAANMTVTHNLTKSGSNGSTLSGGYTIYVAGNLDITGTGVIGSSSTTTITINGTGSQTLSSTGGGGWATLIVNKPSGTLEVTTSISTQTKPLTITSGVVSLQSGVTLSTGALTVASGGTLIGNNANLTLAGNVANAGSIIFKKSAVCGSTDTMAIHSSDATQRQWSGAGTFSFADVEVTKQGGSATITAYSSTNTSGNGANWTFDANCPPPPTTMRIKSGMFLVK